MNREKLRIALIGCGRAGMIHARNFNGPVHGAVLTALCDPSEQALIAACEELGEKKCYTDWNDVMADPEIDAVIVVTPTAFHRDVAVSAARNHKHVFCEKPMASSAEECDEMIEACRENHVLLQIGFMRRFDKSFRRAKQMLEEGTVGPVSLIKSNTYGPSRPKEWMYDVRKNYGPIGEVCSHDFDTLRWFAGSEVRMIHAVGNNFRSQEKKAEYPEYYDTCTVLLEFENGVLGMISGAQYVQYGYDARAEILGTQGIIQVGSQHDNTAIAVTSDKKIQEDSIASWQTLFLDAYRAEDQAFTDAVLNGSEPLVTGTDGKMALILVQEGLRSILEQRPVSLHQGLPG
jgi:myo-inositol 2-dehydrogenase/D-chiro-inositol 1-dehydrogenase/scyllo-inositol 2-dehydrogenase (NAD+)